MTGDKFDLWLERLLLDFSPIVFVASGLYLLAAHGEIPLGVTCILMAVVIVAYRVGVICHSMVALAVATYRLFSPKGSS